MIYCLKPRVPDIITCIIPFSPILLYLSRKVKSQKKKKKSCWQTELSLLLTASHESYTCSRTKTRPELWFFFFKVSWYYMKRAKRSFPRIANCKQGWGRWIARSSSGGSARRSPRSARPLPGRARLTRSSGPPPPFRKPHFTSQNF